MTLQSGRARRAIKRAARTTRCAAALPVSLPVIVSYPGMALAYAVNVFCER
jgi:hypothetical protein